MGVVVVLERSSSSPVVGMLRHRRLLLLLLVRSCPSGARCKIVVGPPWPTIYCRIRCVNSRSWTLVGCVISLPMAATSKPVATRTRGLEVASASSGVDRSCGCTVAARTVVCGASMLRPKTVLRTTSLRIVRVPLGLHGTSFWQYSAPPSHYATIGGGVDSCLVYRTHRTR